MQLVGSREASLGARGWRTLLGVLDHVRRNMAVVCCVWRGGVVSTTLPAIRSMGVFGTCGWEVLGCAQAPAAGLMGCDGLLSWVASRELAGSFLTRMLVWAAWLQGWAVHISCCCACLRRWSATSTHHVEIVSLFLEIVWLGCSTIGHVRAGAWVVGWNTCCYGTRVIVLLGVAGGFVRALC